MDRYKRIAFWLVPLLVLVLGFQFSITAYLIGWGLCLYVVYRAYPAIRADITGAHSRLFPARSWRF